MNDSKTGQVGYYYNHVADSADWYKVTTDLDGALKLTMTSHNGQYIYFKLMDKNGTTLLKSDYTSSSKSYTVDGLAAGTYYVWIYPYYSDGFIPYTIEDTFIMAPVANDPEPNNGRRRPLQWLAAPLQVMQDIIMMEPTTKRIGTKSSLPRMVKLPLPSLRAMVSISTINCMMMMQPLC